MQACSICARGRAPTPGLRGLFERLKTWFMDLYQKAEDLGVEISPQMREVFDGMFTVPYDAADRSFRYAMGDIHSRQVERDFADPATSGGRFAAEDQRLLDAEKKQGMPRWLTSLCGMRKSRADEAVRRREQSSPELRGLVDEANLEIAEIDRQIEHNNIRDEFGARRWNVNGTGAGWGNVLTICGPTTRAACLMRKSRRSSKDAQRLWKGVQASRQAASNQNALAQQLAKQQAEREQIAAVIKKRNTYLQLERKVAILESTLGNWQGREGKGIVRHAGWRPEAAAGLAHERGCPAHGHQGPVCWRLP